MPILSFKASFHPLSPSPYISTLAPFQAEFPPLSSRLHALSIPLRPRMQSPLLQSTGKTSDKARPAAYRFFC